VQEKNLAISGNVNLKLGSPTPGVASHVKNSSFGDRRSDGKDADSKEESKLALGRDGRSSSRRTKEDLLEEDLIILPCLQPGVMT